VDAGEDLDERRLAGAVVADERDDLARVHVEVDVGERGDRAEMLRDPLEAEHEFARGRLSLQRIDHDVPSLSRNFVSRMTNCTPAAADDAAAGRGEPTG